MKNAVEPEVDLPSFLPDAAHEAWFLSEENLLSMGRDPSPKPLRMAGCATRG